MTRHSTLTRKFAWLMTAAVPMVILATAGASQAQTLPSGGQVISGAASIATAGAATTINQSSTKAIINWSDFSIGKGGSVQFNNGSGATLNRVTGGSVSSIDGLLSATGSVYLINPNGVVIGTSGVVKTGGSFVASTLDVADSNFLGGGNLTFSGVSTAAVVNLGSIGSLGGNVVLIGSTVENEGTVTAANGTAGLIAGKTVLMKDTANDEGLFTVAVGGTDTAVTNAGAVAAAAAELRANGGSIYALAGNTDGVITATGVGNKDGHIWLTAGDTGSLSVNETLKAAGGMVETSAGTVDFDGIRVDTSGADGKTGQWLVDPQDLVVDATTAATISTDLATTNVTLQTTVSGNSGPGLAMGSFRGDIDIDSAISWSSANTLTLDSYHSVNISAPITVAGAGGVVIETNDTGGFSNGPPTGTLNLGLNTAGFSGSLQFTGTPGSGQSVTINGTSYTLLYSMSDLASASGNVALAQSIDAGGHTYSSAIAAVFTANLEGLGNTITNLTINSNDFYVGLFGQNNGTISDLGLTNVSIAGYNYATGAFAGRNNGTITQSLLTGSVSGGGDYLGGIAGVNNYGNLTYDLVAADIYSTAWATGGVAGWNSGLISNLNVQQSIVSAGGVVIGGVVGYNDIGFVVDTQMANNIVNGSGEALGELIGWNRGYVTGNVIANSAGSTDYALSGWASHMGGLIGVNEAGNDVNGGVVIDNTVVDAVVSEGGEVSAGGLVGWNSGTLDTNVVGAYGNQFFATPVAATSPYQTGVTSNAGAVGGDVGWNQGISTLDTVYQIAVTTDGTATHAGGLVGVNAGSGSISGGFSLDVAVSGTAVSMGGLIGWNAGRNSGGVAGGTTVLETALGFNYAGGLVGVNTGDIEYASTSQISVTDYGVAAGGLVGDNRGTILRSEAANTVISNYYYGGFAGMNEGTITDSYWDTEASHLNTGVGLDNNPSATALTGLTTAQLAGIILH